MSTSRYKISYFLLGFIFALITVCVLKAIVERSIKDQDAARQVEVADQLSCDWNIKHSTCFCSRPSFRDRYNVEHPEIITWVPERICGK